MPSESVEDAEEKFTVSGAWPEVGLAFATAVGAWLALTVTVTVAVAVSPLSSVTVSVAVYSPAVA